jgi:hypothetical protein
MSPEIIVILVTFYIGTLGGVFAFQQNTINQQAIKIEKLEADLRTAFTIIFKMVNDVDEKAREEIREEIRHKFDILL